LAGACVPSRLERLCERPVGPHRDDLHLRPGTNDRHRPASKLFADPRFQFQWPVASVLVFLSHDVGAGPDRNHLPFVIVHFDSDNRDLVTGPQNVPGCFEPLSQAGTQVVDPEVDRPQFAKLFLPHLERLVIHPLLNSEEGREPASGIHHPGNDAAVEVPAKIVPDQFVAHFKADRWATIFDRLDLSAQHFVERDKRVERVFDRGEKFLF
jgi:hypothetical protein